MRVLATQYMTHDLTSQSFFLPPRLCINHLPAVLPISSAPASFDSGTCQHHSPASGHQWLGGQDIKYILPNRGRTAQHLKVFDNLNHQDTPLLLTALLLSTLSLLIAEYDLFFDFVVIDPVIVAASPRLGPAFPGLPLLLLHVASIYTIRQKKANKLTLKINF